jgi:hypothetical protein
MAVAGIRGLLTWRADVDSRSGALYCQMCDDIVWDPTFEELRLKKLGTGTFSSMSSLGGRRLRVCKY